MIRENRSRGRRSHLSSISTIRACSGGPEQKRTHKKVVCVWHIAANTEQLHKIVELAMDVTANLYSFSISNANVLRCTSEPYRHRRIHAHHVSFFNEQLSCLVAHFANLRFRYRATCSKLFYVSAACQELAHRPLIACAYLSRSLILAIAPHGAAVVWSDFCSSARVRFAPPDYKSVGLNRLVCSVVATLRRKSCTAVLLRILCRIRK